jgi:hypothetical protein
VVARGVANVQGATGKTVNAISKIVNAAMPASPMRAQIYLTTGFSLKWISRILAIKPFKTIKIVNRALFIFGLS